MVSLGFFFVFYSLHYYRLFLSSSLSSFLLETFLKLLVFIDFLFIPDSDKPESLLESLSVGLDLSTDNAPDIRIFFFLEDPKCHYL